MKLNSCKLKSRRSVLLVLCGYAVIISGFANGYIPASIQEIETTFSLTATQVAVYGITF